MPHASNELVFEVEVRQSSKGNFCCCIPECMCAATADSIEELLEVTRDMIVEYITDREANKLPLPQPQLVSPTKDSGFISLQSIVISWS